ncbi:hypothetical protein AAHC03_019314 [Spirometra sp. Aus1]
MPCLSLICCRLDAGLQPQQRSLSLSKDLLLLPAQSDVKSPALVKSVQSPNLAGAAMARVADHRALTMQHSPHDGTFRTPTFLPFCRELQQVTVLRSFLSPPWLCPTVFPLLLN